MNAEIRHEKLAFMPINPERNASYFSYWRQRVNLHYFLGKPISLSQWVSYQARMEMALGIFAEGIFAEGIFAEGIFDERNFRRTEFSMNGNFAERKFLLCSRNIR